MKRSQRLFLSVAAMSLLLVVLGHGLMFGRIPNQTPAPRMPAPHYDNWTLDLGGGYSLVPDHDWTLKLGRACYGMQGYLSASRSLTRIVRGRFSLLIPLPLSLVPGLGFVSAAALGLWYHLSRNRKETADVVGDEPAELNQGKTPGWVRPYS
jgi:hypothetical protein